MQKRAVRFTLLALLLIAGAGAGLIAWTITSHISAFELRRADVAARLDRILTSISEIGAAQHAYVAPGQSAQEAFEQVASLVQRVQADVQSVRPMLESVEAAELVAMLTSAAATLVEADSSARNYYRTGQTLWAAEVVFGQSQDTLATMTQAVRALEAAESRVGAAAMGQMQRTLWSVLGGGAALWALGLLALTWLPRQDTAGPAATAPAAADILETAEPLPAPAPAQVAPGIDLGATAAVCTDISRLSASTQLPDLLGRAAAVIDAAGIIVWMGAGDDLFAAAAHGYDQRVVSRLGAIPRSADNATAAAFRSGEPRAVPGDMMTNGAIVAPMFGPDGCVGVLAAEVRNGREADDATRAVTAMIAAQLATVVTAWPAASAPASTPALQPDAPPLREASGL